MKPRLIGAAMAAAVLLASACTASVEVGEDSAGGATMAQAMDRWQIEELLWRYARTLDSADADGYAALYTPDGSFTSGQMSMQGREALHKFVADLKRSREERQAKGENPGATLHMTANHRIEFTGPDSATVHSYWITMFPGSGAEDPARVGAVGRAEDQLVRLDGKWLIKVRNVAPQD